jgi:hypothetical protein
VTSSDTDPGALTDEELWCAYMGDDPREAGEAFIRIYMRYRDTMRSTMEVAGLSDREAENRVGSVFTRGLDVNDRSRLPLRARLEDAARLVANDPDWGSVS